MVTKAEAKREAKKAEERRNRRAALFTILSLAAGFGSWAYFVLAANPNFYLGVTLLFTSALFIAIAVLEFFRRTSLKLLLVICVAVVSWFSLGWAKEQWEIKIRNDVVMRLDITPMIPSSGNIWESIVRVKNNSSSSLSHYQITCRINQLLTQYLHMSGGGGIQNKSKGEPLGIGGDGVSDKCLAGLFTNVTPIHCADIIFVVDYTVDGWPTVEGAKELRFVTDDGKWTEQPLRGTSTPCR